MDQIACPGLLYIISSFYHVEMRRNRNALLSLERAMYEKASGKQTKSRLKTEFCGISAEFYDIRVDHHMRFSSFFLQAWTNGIKVVSATSSESFPQTYFCPQVSVHSHSAFFKIFLYFRESRPFKVMPCDHIAMWTISSTLSIWLQQTSLRMSGFQKRPAIAKPISIWIGMPLLDAQKPPESAEC